MYTRSTAAIETCFNKRFVANRQLVSPKTSNNSCWMYYTRLENEKCNFPEYFACWGGIADSK